MYSSNVIVLIYFIPYHIVSNLVFLDILNPTTEVIQQYTWSKFYHLIAFRWLLIVEKLCCISQVFSLYWWMHILYIIYLFYASSYEFVGYAVHYHIARQLYSFKFLLTPMSGNKVFIISKSFFGFCNKFQDVTLPLLLS